MPQTNMNNGLCGTNEQEPYKTFNKQLPIIPNPIFPQNPKVDGPKLRGKLGHTL
jgi:hypothetical protein